MRGWTCLTVNLYASQNSQKLDLVTVARLLDDNVKGPKYVTRKCASKTCCSLHKCNAKNYKAYSLASDIRGPKPCSTAFYERVRMRISVWAARRWRPPLRPSANRSHLEATCSISASAARLLGGFLRTAFIKRQAGELKFLH
jgi:hypothetical protein